MKKLSFALIALAACLTQAHASQPDHSKVISEPDHSHEPRHAFDLQSLSGRTYRLVESQPDNELDCGAENGITRLTYTITNNDQDRGFFDPRTSYNKLEVGGWGGPFFQDIDQGVDSYVRYDVENPTILERIGCDVLFHSLPQYCGDMSQKPVPAYNPSYTVFMETKTAREGDTLSVTSIDRDVYKPTSSTEVVESKQFTLSFQGDRMIYTIDQKRKEDPAPIRIQTCTYE